MAFNKSKLKRLAQHGKRVLRHDGAPKPDAPPSNREARRAAASVARRKKEARE